MKLEIERLRLILDPYSKQAERLWNKGFGPNSKHPNLAKPDRHIDLYASSFDEYRRRHSKLLEPKALKAWYEEACEAMVVNNAGIENFDHIRHAYNELKSAL